MCAKGVNQTYLSLHHSARYSSDVSEQHLQSQIKNKLQTWALFTGYRYVCIKVGHSASQYFILYLVAVKLVTLVLKIICSCTFNNTIILLHVALIFSIMFQHFSIYIFIYRYLEDKYKISAIS